MNVTDFRQHPSKFTFVKLLLAAGVLLSCAGIFQAWLNRTPGYSFDLRTNIRSISDRSSASKTRNQKHLVHDFGIVRPLEPLQATLVVLNDSLDRWTLSSVQTSCGCAVASISPEVIEPGTAASLKVNYTPGGLSIDDARRIAIFFRESSAPELSVVIKASIRPELSVSSSQLLFDNCASGIASQRFQVWNYGAKLWGGIDVSVPGGAVHAALVNRPEEKLPAGAIQGWTVEVLPNVQDQSPDAVLFDEVRVEAVGSTKSHQTEVRVEVAKASGIRVAPRQLLVRSDSLDQIVTLNLCVRFPVEVLSIDDQVSIQTDFAGQLTPTWSKINGRIWKLTVEIVPRSALHEVRDASMEIRHLDYDPVVLPIIVASSL